MKNYSNDNPWATRLKNGEFPRQLREVIRKKGEPLHIWRESLLDEIYPIKESGRVNKRRADDVVAKEYRKKITVCMSDPDVLGYSRDGGNSHNPRFKRLVK